MSALAPLFSIFERIPVDELRLSTGDIPFVLHGSEIRPVATSATTSEAILGAAAELLSREELEALEEDCPQAVRHEHQGQAWTVEITRIRAGYALVVRRALAVVTRLDAHRPSALEGEAEVATCEAVREAVGAGLVSRPPPAPSARSARASWPRGLSTPPRAGGPLDRRRFDDLLRAMLADGASDLHLSAANPPVVRVDGEIIFARQATVLSSFDIESMLLAVMTPKVAAQFTDHRDADFGYEIPGHARFRVNAFEDRNGVGAVVRQIPLSIRSASQLGLPKVCTDLCSLTKGLVLVTGPTGSGKSTTLAAMINHVNETRSDHIVTIEDPIEFVHPNQRCLVNQREVGHNTRTWKAALRAALREDPDVVMVGELRDLETIAIAIEMAETGHLVFATLHTTTAVGTVDRMVDQFPADRQAQVRSMLSESLKGVIAQTLCRRVGGGRIAALEIMLGNPAVASLIREGKTFQIPSVMQTSRAQGMVTLNDSLCALVKQQLVEPKEAYLHAVDKNGLALMFKGANVPFAA